MLAAVYLSFFFLKMNVESPAKTLVTGPNMIVNKNSFSLNGASNLLFHSINLSLPSMPMTKVKVVNMNAAKAKTVEILCL